jgi:hypothetical protein
MQYLYIRHNNLYLVALTKRNTNAAEILLFLHKIVEVFTEYFKELEEESIRDNFVIIYELLDEMMDFGYPQTTESKILQEYEPMLRGLYGYHPLLTWVPIGTLPRSHTSSKSKRGHLSQSRMPLAGEAKASGTVRTKCSSTSLNLSTSWSLQMETCCGLKFWALSK